MTTGRQSPISTHGRRLLRIVGTSIAAYTACILLSAAAHADDAAVVTDHVVSQATYAQSDVPVTFGQVFKTGDVPRGATLTARVDGQSVPLQVNAKAMNADGSLRHAVLTAVVPSLSSDATMPLTLTADSSPGVPDTALKLSQLLETPYDAQVSLNINGTLYTAHARSMLAAARNASACAPWDAQCNLWLSGPLVSEWVVNGPAIAADGTSAPNLRVYFAVRAYASTSPGVVGYVRTDIIVENTSAFSPQGQPQYTATLSSGSASYDSPKLTQYTATRWHKALWWNGIQPKVYLQQDTQYIQASKAVSKYMPLKPDEKFLASLRQSCAPLEHCDQSQGMANTGAQEAIGPLPRWTSVYIVDPDARAYHWMLANTDALGGYSIHYRDAQTGWPISIRQHPHSSIINWASTRRISTQNSAKGAAYRADVLPNCINNAVVNSCSGSWYGTGNPNVWDNAHQPAESYVPYMVTGDYYYMSELAFGASHNEVWSNDSYRGFSKGLIDGSHGQVRAKAWVLREMADAAWLLPDHHPLKTEFVADVDNSLADWNAKYTDNPDTNPLGLMAVGAVYSVNGGHHNGIAPWQHNFLTWSAGHAAELGFSGAARFRDWLAKFEIGLMTDWQHNPTQGYCWLKAAAYSIQVKDSAGNWLPSFTAVYGTNWPELVGLECNSPAMLAKIGKERGKPLQAGEMSGYPYSATGFPSNFQIGVATAADSGLPEAADAWRLFDSRTVKPSGSSAYNNYPNFALIPRFPSATTTPPSTTQPSAPSSSNPPHSDPPPSDPTPANPPPSDPPPSDPPPSDPPPSDPPPSSTPKTTTSYVPPPARLPWLQSATKLRSGG